MSESEPLQAGQRVIVDMLTGPTLPGEIVKVADEGPYEQHPQRNIQVRFDDPLVMGGTGIGWVTPEQLTVEP